MGFPQTLRVAMLVLQPSGHVFTEESSGVDFTRLRGYTFSCFTSHLMAYPHGIPPGRWRTGRFSIFKLGRQRQGRGYMCEKSCHLIPPRLTCEYVVWLVSDVCTECLLHVVKKLLVHVGHCGSVIHTWSAWGMLFRQSTTLNDLPTENRSTCQWLGILRPKAKGKGRANRARLVTFCGWVVAPEHPGTSASEQLRSAKYRAST